MSAFINVKTSYSKSLFIVRVFDTSRESYRCTTNSYQGSEVGQMGFQCLWTFSVPTTEPGVGGNRVIHILYQGQSMWRAKPWLVSPPLLFRGMNLYSTLFLRGTTLLENKSEELRSHRKVVLLGAKQSPFPSVMGAKILHHNGPPCPYVLD